jgi:hypothetical protein
LAKEHPRPPAFALDQAASLFAEISPGFDKSLKNSMFMIATLDRASAFSIANYGWI